MMAFLPEAKEAVKVIEEWIDEVFKQESGGLDLDGILDEELLLRRRHSMASKLGFIKSWVS